LLGFACATIAVPAKAEGYPDRPIKLAVPFGAGGGGDVSTRVLAAGMSDILGKPIIIENQPSAGGMSAARGVLKANPDGYSMLLIGNIYAIAQSLLAHVPYDVVKDFTPISLVVKTDVAIFSAKQSPFSSVQDLIAQAKRKPNTINIGVGLFGTTQHLTAELFKSEAGIEATIVPFSNSGQLQTAVRSGDVDVGFDLLAPVLGALTAGEMKPLAVAGNKRSPFLPATPTLTESEIPVEATSWSLMAVRSGTPEAIVARLNQVIVQALASSELQQKFSALSLEPVSSNVADAHQLLVAEIAKWKHAIQVAKIPQQ